MQYVGTFLIQGAENSADALLEKLEKENVIQRGSPDLLMRSYRKFGVDEAEDLRGRVRVRPIAGEQRVFVLFVPSATREAQNALLKTLEEPAANAAIFLIAPAPETFLPTIRSRAQKLEIENTTKETTLVDADDFLAASAEKRLTMLKPLYDHDADEGRDIGAVIAFLSALENRFAKGKLTPETKEGIDAIYRARKYATDKGSLLKALLEHVALLVPQL